MRVWLGGALTLVVSGILLTYCGLAAMMGNPYDHDPVQSVVVLGRGPEQNAVRALAAAQLWQENRARSIFVSGMTDAPRLISLIREMGVPESQINGERCSQNTWENALFTRVMLSNQKIHRVLLVTDKPHMARAATVFRNFGFEVVPYPISSDLSVEQVQSQFRELLGLFAYGASGKLTSPSPELITSSTATAKVKIKEWDCGLD